MWSAIFSGVSSFVSSYINYIKIGICIVSLLLSSFIGWHIGHSKYVNYKAEVEAAAEKQIAENKAKEIEQQLINKGVEDAYKANIANIHNFYNGMLNASSGAMSTNGTATITINGQTHNLLSVAEQCAETTQQLESLQDWVNQQIGLK
jgi:hypothetical protein